jgi:hypothetical protein
MSNLANPGESPTGHWFGETMDRAWRTGLQVLAGYLSVAQTVQEVNWVAALLAALFAMLVSGLTRLLDMPSLGEAWYWQVAERMVKTFVQTLLVMIGAATAFADVDWKIALNTALMATVYSFVTSVLTTRAGDAATRGSVPLTAPRSLKVTHSEARTAGGGF